MPEFHSEPWYDSGITRYVAGAVIICDHRALCLRRRMDDFMGGIWELPSGRVEPSESLDAAVHREVLEETGLEVVSIDKLLGWFDYTSASGRATRQVNLAIAVLDGPIVLSEHDAVAWVGAGDLDARHMTCETRSVVRHALASGAAW